MFVSAIIAAGGRGQRVGADVPKQLLRVGGRTLLERSLLPFERSASIDELVVVVPGDLVGQAEALLAACRTPLRVVPGGERRQDSVAAGVDAVAAEANVIAVHDAARPFCTEALVERVVRAAAETGAAIAAVPVHDTVKEARRDADTLRVAATLPRERIYLAQTPQAFARAVLQDAVAAGRAGADATDEATLAERAGHAVQLVPGEPANMKITTARELALARAVAAPAPGQSRILRVGVGYDLHRLVTGRRLVLGGVEIPGPRGLAGHSDADALCHAVTDAILGAAAVGDIGQLFPDDDPRWQGAASLELLQQAMSAVQAQGYVVENVDAVVIAEWPKIRPHVDAMRRNLGQALAIDPGRVMVKGKSGEGVGAIGAGEAIAVHAVAMVSREPTAAA